MSIAEKLNWVVATKPAAPKATEHSGAKKGKGAWTTKRDAKKTSNKGRRASDKKESTTGDDANTPFPGAAPLFTKASEMNWGSPALSEPRPCYPDEDPVEDHCNPNISPEGDEDGDWGDQGFEVFDPGSDPMDDEPGGEEEEWSPERWEQEIERDKPPEAPEPQEQAPDPSRQAPPVPRDPSLGPNEPHQFWQSPEEWIQTPLPDLMKRAQEGNENAQRLLFEGPRVGRYDKKSLYDTLRDPAFYEKKGTQKYKQQVEKEEGLEPGSIGPIGEPEAKKMRERLYTEDKPENIV
jgi:hypothetical protein